MKEIIMTLKLTKVLAKTIFSDFSFNNKEKKGNKIMWAILVVAFLPMIISLCAGTVGGYLFLEQLGLESFIIKASIAVMAVLYFFTGIFYCISVLYYSKDNERVFSFPLKMWQIISGRFLTMVIYEYLFLAAVFLPIIISYGVISKASIVFYIYMLVVASLVSVIPLVICSMLIMLLMGFSKLFQNRDRVNIIGSLILVFFVIGINISINNSMAGLEAVNVNGILDVIQNKFTNGINMIFAGISFGADALNNYQTWSGLGYLIFYIVACLGWFLLMLGLGSIIYKKGVLGINSSTIKGKAFKKGEFDKYCKPKSRFVTYMVKDIKLILRTPAYLMNNAITVFLMPIILTLTLIMPALGDDPDLKKFFEVMSNISLGISNPSTIIGLGIIFGFSCFNASLNGIAATAVSREGQSAFYMKMIPYDLKKQLLSKASVGALAGLISTILILGLVGFIFKVSTLFIFIAGIISLVGIIALNIWGIFLDALMPKLSWDNEQKAVKQNPNLLINMVVASVLGGGSASFAIFGRPLVLFMNIDFIWVYVGATILFSVGLSILAYYLMIANMEKIRANIS